MGQADIGFEVIAEVPRINDLVARLEIDGGHDVALEVQRNAGGRRRADEMAAEPGICSHSTGLASALDRAIWQREVSNGGTTKSQIESVGRSGGVGDEEIFRGPGDAERKRWKPDIGPHANSGFGRDEAQCAVELSDRDFSIVEHKPCAGGRADKSRSRDRHPQLKVRCRPYLDHPRAGHHRNGPTRGRRLDGGAEVVVVVGRHDGLGIVGADSQQRLTALIG